MANASRLVRRHAAYALPWRPTPVSSYTCESRTFAAGEDGTMRWVLAAIVLASALMLMSGCMHVNPTWPLKVDAETGRVRYA
jgi:hypothetical protein